LAEHEHSSQTQSRWALAAALGITTFFMVVEVVGGLLTNSLALLSDAGHMLSDASALGLSLLAVWLAGQAHTPGRTFGYHRAEILAALVNGLTLGAISIYIFWEAARRFAEPPDVQSAPMLIVAVIGLAANGVSGAILSRYGGGGLNVRSAFLHVLGDALGSVGAIVAGVVMLTTGWFLADPLISVGIGVLILISGARVTREALRIVLEFVPKHIDIAEVRTTVLSVEGVTDVHDLHVWTITSGFVALSCHAQVRQDANAAEVLRSATDALTRRFQIRHVTIQPEHEPMHGEEPGVCCLDEHAMEPRETGAS
jgi:cobalt-zinc-cadmium efflux system protein